MTLGQLPKGTLLRARFHRPHWGQRTWVGEVESCFSEVHDGETYWYYNVWVWDVVAGAMWGKQFVDRFCEALEVLPPEAVTLSGVVEKVDLVPRGSLIARAGYREIFCLGPRSLHNPDHYYVTDATGEPYNIHQSEKVIRVLGLT